MTLKKAFLSYISFLMLIESIFYINKLSSEFIVVFGIFFLKGNPANVLLIAILAGIAVFSFGYAADSKKYYKHALLFYCTLLANSIFNIVLLNFLSNDYMHFFKSVFGSDITKAYLITEALSAVLLFIICTSLIFNKKRLG